MHLHRASLLSLSLLAACGGPEADEVALAGATELLPVEEKAEDAKVVEEPTEPTESIEPTEFGVDEASEEDWPPPPSEDELAKDVQRIAWIVVGGPANVSSGRYDEKGQPILVPDARLFAAYQALAAGYATAGYSVRVFANSPGFDPIFADIAGVAAGLVKAGRTKQIANVAWHYVGHGGLGGGAATPPESTTDYVLVQWRAEDFSVKAATATQEEIGATLAKAFNRKHFPAVQYSGAFDACRQGNAIANFKRGVCGFGWGALVQRMTSTSVPKTWEEAKKDVCKADVGAYSIAFGLAAPPSPAGFGSLEIAHGIAAKAAAATYYTQEARYALDLCP